MNTKDLQWFQTICDCKSMTQASKVLFVSQQALSKCIKNLEQQLDVVLLIRTHNGIEPTQCGRLLYEKSEQIIKDWNNLTQDLRSMAHMEKGYLKLCSAYGILRILSPDFLFEFEKKYPNRTIDYMEYPDLHVDDEILRGNFDVALSVDGEVLPGFISVPLFSSSISLLAYKEHPLARKTSVTVMDLKGEEMIIESAAFYIHHFWRKACTKAGFEPNIIFNTSGFSLCHQLCRQKRGLSLVVERISQDMQQSDLVRIPFEVPMIWNVVLSYREELNDYEIIQAFQEHTIEWIKAHPDLL